MPEIIAYEESIRDEVAQRMGERLRLIRPHAGTIFPNLSLLRSISRTFRIWQPKGPGKTEIQAAVYVDKAAPPEVKEAFRRTAIRTFGPSGVFEQDDMDNWEGCSMSGRGVVSRRHDLNISMGLGHASYDEDLGGVASDYRLSENNHRAFYRRWSQLMDSNDWPA